MTNGYILNIYNNDDQCPKDYEKESICISYFFKKFNEFPRVLNIKHSDYLTSIKNFHDPILKYVALYLYHNYEIAQQYFKNGSNKNNNAACSVLNKWLNQEKNFYTNFGRCYFNLRWWNSYIEPLWNDLESKFKNNNNNNKRCERYKPYYYQESYLKSLKEEDKYRCYNLQVEDHVCYKNVNGTKTKEQDDDNESLQENCAKLSILFYLGEKYKLLNNNSVTTPSTTNNYCPTEGNPEKIYYKPVLKAEKLCFCDSFISAIAFPTVVTVLGTIFFAFFLNEFTPIGSILGNSYKNNVRFRENFNEEASCEEYETYRNINQNTSREKNIIYYQSMN